MTFNQWASKRPIPRSLRISLNAIWDRLAAGSQDFKEIQRVMDDLMESIEEEYA